MDIYQVNHQQLLKGIRCNFQRYLYKQIQWDDRLIGIFGSQGVGKTTLLLQRIKQAFDDSDKALYLNLDSILFQREKMVNVAMQFYKEGGTHICFWTACTVMPIGWRRPGSCWNVVRI